MRCVRYEDVESRICSNHNHVASRTTATSDPTTLHLTSINMSTLSQLAVPFVYGLIFFLGYPSQWMLMQLEPGPLTKNELIVSNVILVLIWITYTKSVFVDPGTIPNDWVEKELGNEKERVSEKEGDAVAKSRKWCRKCDAAKPPRAHHCKECKRYAGETVQLSCRYVSY